MGRSDWRNHWRRGDWSCSRRSDWRVARYGPPPPGGFPIARWAGTPGFYYSPYTGRVYDLRGVPPGGLTRDVDTGRLFRKP